jgi:hypothetical protein
MLLEVTRICNQINYIAVALFKKETFSYIVNDNYVEVLMFHVLSFFTQLSLKNTHMTTQTTQEGKYLFP